MSLLVHRNAAILGFFPKAEKGPVGYTVKRMLYIWPWSFLLRRVVLSCLLFLG